jgi:hypothetical protein
MNKNLLSIFGFLLLFNFTTNAQQIGNSITEKVKVLLEQEKEHLPKTNLHLVADSFAINQQKLEIYFNTKQSFQQSSLPSDYLEMLPEILMPLSDQFNTQSILLFAKDC